MNHTSTSAGDQAPRGGNEPFTETKWTQVGLAARADSPAGRDALEALCSRYWPTIYSFLRRKGHAPADAEDLTQGFFARLLTDESLAAVDRRKGRFRSFLLGALDRYLIDEARRQGAVKRGRHLVVSANAFPELEASYLAEVSPDLTPAQACDRRWVRTQLEVAMRQLESEMWAAGQQSRFELLKPFLAENPQSGDYDLVAAKLGIVSKAVAAAVSRLRQRYRELVREVVRETVSDQQELEQELRELFGRRGS